MLYAPLLGAGCTRSSTYTSTNAASAATAASFCPVPPETLKLTSKNGMLGTAPLLASEKSHSAAMSARKRCFFTVA